MAKATLENLRVRLAAVEQALADPDEFGLCKVCGDDIGYKRLKARPEAPLCLGCQEERESG
jgi:DnaK suppressor protein